MPRAAFQTFPKITNVTTEIWSEEVPAANPDLDIQTYTVFRATIWLEANNGVYARDLIEGESLKDVVEGYRQLGHIDDACCYFGERRSKAEDDAYWAAEAESDAHHEGWADKGEEENDAWQLACLEEDADWYSRRDR